MDAKQGDAGAVILPRDAFSGLIVPPYSFEPPQPVGAFVNPSAANGEKVWRNSEPYQSWIAERTLLQALPGCDSDGASVPRLFHSLRYFGPFVPETWPGAFAHDLLYAAELLSRPEADRIFRALLIRGGTPASKAVIMFAAVRLCGWYPWNRHAPESVAAYRERVRLVEFDAAGAPVRVIPVPFAA
jgi:hypothetical protein